MVDIAKISMGLYFSQIREIPWNKDLRVNSVINWVIISEFGFLIASE